MRRNVEYFAIGSLVGLAAGVLLGLLFAPTSGARLRKGIADQAVRAGETARNIANRTESVADTVSVRVTHLLGRDEETAKRKIREIREGVDNYTQAQPG